MKEFLGVHSGDCPPGYRDDVHPVQILESVSNHSPGYGKVASFQTVDRDLLIFRKFNLLRNRTLLYMQDELKYLEEELHAADECDPRRLISRRLDFSPGSTSYRKDLMPRIREKLIAYDELLLRTRKIEAIPRPRKRAQRTLFRLVRNSGSLAPGERDWIRYGSDLASLAKYVDYEHGWFAALMENSLMLLPNKLTVFLFQGKEEAIMAGTEATFVLFSSKRFGVLPRLTCLILTAGILVILFAVLYEVKHAE